jgi:hypothetical protein
MQTFPRKRQAMNREDAEKLAISALSFLAGEEHRLAGFLMMTGLSPADLRARIGSVEVLAGVLDFIVADESLLLVFATEQRIDPATIMTARHLLLPEASEY